ncbi:hypothetical protein LWI28_022232 [Acer negundo]|uniref:R13L1/DRL21-like LRR repeat region domain-containing protein n=1 Tax=Acer negundo TaxID=4023 RepID=A0AAD5IFK5_ACENE|nr:hypothetical protein LWI28_022232 [Acer negundo]
MTGSRQTKHRCTPSKTTSGSIRSNKSGLDKGNGILKAKKALTMSKKEIPSLSQDEVLEAFRAHCPGRGLASLSMVLAGVIVALGFASVVVVGFPFPFYTCGNDQDQDQDQILEKAKKIGVCPATVPEFVPALADDTTTSRGLLKNEEAKDKKQGKEDMGSTHEGQEQGGSKIEATRGSDYSRKACSLEFLNQFGCLEGSLGIKGLGNVTNVSDVQRIQLKNKKNIFKLELGFGGSDSVNNEAIIEALQPPPNLRVLVLSEYAGNTVLPHWITSLTDLRKIWLVEWINCEQLPPLGKVLSLESIHIQRMNRVKRVGIEILGLESDGITLSSSSSSVSAFPKLKSLRFLEMEEWEEWDFGIEDDNITIMSSLRLLQIRDCPKLKVLPKKILQMAPLEVLSINRCPILSERYIKGIGENWLLVYRELMSNCKKSGIFMPGCIEKKGQEQCSFNLFVCTFRVSVDAIYFLMFEIVHVCMFSILVSQGKITVDDGEARSRQTSSPSCLGCARRRCRASRISSTVLDEPWRRWFVKLDDDVWRSLHNSATTSSNGRRPLVMLEQPSGTISFPFLKELSLDKVFINEQMVQEMTQGNALCLKNWFSEAVGV